MFRNLSPKTLGISGTPSETIELALSHGFKGLDLDIVDFAEQVREKGLPIARRLLDSAKLKIGAFPLPVDWHADDETFKRDLERLPGLAALAFDLGCTRTVTTIEPGCDSRHYHQNFEFHRQRLGEIAKVLAPTGVQLGIGFNAAVEARAGKAFEFIRDLDSLLMLLGMLGAAQVGVVVDTWQLAASGATIEAIRKVPKDKLVTVQLADVAADADITSWTSTSRVLPGETGTVDCAAALVILAELGYDGPVTPAPHASRFKGMGRDAIAKLSGTQLDKVWKAAGLTPAGKLASPATQAAAPAVAGRR